MKSVKQPLKGLGEEGAPGGKNMELASSGPWRDTSTPVLAIAAKYDWNGASARGARTPWISVGPFG